MKSAQISICLLTGIIWFGLVTSTSCYHPLDRELDDPSVGDSIVGDEEFDLEDSTSFDLIPSEYSRIIGEAIISKELYYGHEQNSLSEHELPTRLRVRISTLFYRARPACDTEELPVNECTIHFDLPLCREDESCFSDDQCMPFCIDSRSVSREDDIDFWSTIDISVAPWIDTTSQGIFAEEGYYGRSYESYNWTYDIQLNSEIVAEIDGGCFTGIRSSVTTPPELVVLDDSRDMIDDSFYYHNPIRWESSGDSDRIRIIVFSCDSERIMTCEVEGSDSFRFSEEELSQMGCLGSVQIVRYNRTVQNVDNVGQFALTAGSSHYFYLDTLFADPSSGQ